jgi:hypothetical protein
VWATNSHTLFFSPLRSEGQGQPSERSRWRYVCERNDMQVCNRLEDEVCVLHYGLAIPRSRRWLALARTYHSAREYARSAHRSCSRWLDALAPCYTTSPAPAFLQSTSRRSTSTSRLSSCPGACSRSRPCTVFAVNAVPHCSREYLPSAPANDRRQLRWSYQRG